MLGIVFLFLPTSLERSANLFRQMEFVKTINEVFVQEAIYLRRDLSVAEFAKILGIDTRVATRLIRQHYGHTFMELTNMYRVEYARNRIKEGFLDRSTLDALGTSAGFRSRAAFINVFKREIGIDPSEYWNTMSHRLSAEKVS